MRADSCNKDWFAVPNFEVQQHWPESILHLGPVGYTDLRLLPLKSFS
jgi:hypothetical protein